MSMRLPLIALLAAFLAAVFPSRDARASSIDDLLVVSIHTYVDDTHQAIFSTKADLTRRVAQRWGVGASVGVDAISGATPSSDTVSGDEDGGNESSTRVYPSLSLKYDDGVHIASLGGYYSAETDYTGQSLFLDYTQVMNLGNTAAGVALSQSADRWEISEVDPDNRDERVVSFSLTQTISPGAQARLVWTGLHSEGYLGSPYRFIDIGTVRVPERLPAQRDGEAVALKLVTLLNESTSLHIGYRYYSDDWSISSHTVDTALYRDISGKWTLGGRLRYYTQTDAEFIRPIADIQVGDPLVAIDYKNTAFDTYTAGVEFHYTPGGEPGWLLDWDKAKIKGGVDLYGTSSNPFIENWYGQDSIIGAVITVSMEYDY